MSLTIFSRILESFKHKPVALPMGVTSTYYQIRASKRKASVPRLRVPYWYQKKDAPSNYEHITEENKNFIQKIMNEQYLKTSPTPLKVEPIPKGKWFPGCRRCGVIAKKIGIIPQWLKDGTMTYTSLLQVIENHVINYIPPGPIPDKRCRRPNLWNDNVAFLVVGAVDSDPQKFTKEYCGLFTKSGVMPKKILTKFPIHPEAAIQPGTPLYAAHFEVGDSVDVTGYTISQGFQGVMKRWGFSGMPASHGQTKTHRRPGNIGAGGEKARVWPGKKMPGHVGYKRRTICRLKILRINHEKNLLYVKGRVPGNMNTFVFIRDTLISMVQRKEAPPFPTYYPDQAGKKLPEEEFEESIFNFADPTITFEPEKVKAKGKK